MDYFRIGVIANTHALKGEIKIYPTTDEPTRFLDMEELIIARENAAVSDYKTYKIEKLRNQKNLLICKLQDVDTIEEAEKLKNYEILVHRDDAIELGEDEYFWADLIGMRVVADDGEELGVLNEILATGANDVYSVEKDGTKPLLLPAIPDCILEINEEEKLMTVHLMKGLRD